MRLSTSRSLLAGPRVATIFVLRCIGSKVFACAALFEDFHRRKLFAFQELEEGAARSGYIADLARHPEFGQGGDGLASTRQGEGGRGSDSLRDRTRASCKLLVLENTQRPVPDDGAGLPQQFAQVRRGLRPNIQNQVVRGDLRRFLGGRRGCRGQLLRDYD